MHHLTGNRRALNAMFLELDAVLILAQYGSLKFLIEEHVESNWCWLSPHDDNIIINVVHTAYWNKTFSDLRNNKSNKLI